MRRRHPRNFPSPYSPQGYLHIRMQATPYNFVQVLKYLKVHLADEVPDLVGSHVGCGFPSMKMDKSLRLGRDTEWYLNSLGATAIFCVYPLHVSYSVPRDDLRRW